MIQKTDCFRIGIKSININSLKIRQFRLKNVYKTYDFSSCSTTKIKNIYLL